jgi:hypothetical protein
MGKGIAALNGDPNRCSGIGPFSRGETILDPGQKVIPQKSILVKHPIADDADFAGSASLQDRKASCMSNKPHCRFEHRSEIGE